MSKAVFKMSFDCGRMGELNGVFVAEKSHVKTLVEKGINVYFGEVLGKHSEIYGPITDSEIELVSEDENVIKVIIDNSLESGYNPFDYSFVDVENDFEVETVGELIEKIIESES